jgi:hypothetical protein
VKGAAGDPRLTPASNKIMVAQKLQTISGDDDYLYRVNTDVLIAEGAKMRRLIAIVPAMATGGAVCAATPFHEPVLRSVNQEVAVRDSNAPNSRPINQRFRTLDEYLAFLAKGAAIDKPWYRQIRPGIYRLETTNYRSLQPDGSDEKRIFTRAELAKKFGFAE